jgi:tRNA dimethylallyltransferase
VQKTKTVIVIVGPTASGKTELSLELAAHFNTAIISADSRQCFRELNIGVAKPPPEALRSIKHYFIDSHSISDDVNAQCFEEYALDAVSEIFIKNDTAIMVGGTGLYIKAFCEGLDEIPAVDAAVRRSIVESYKKNGLSWLQNEVREKDPAFFRSGENKNPQRLMRAFEVIVATGRSITSFRTSQKKARPFRIIKLGINLSKEKLVANIDARVDAMISAGLVDEVRALLPYRDLNALQTVGYNEVFSFLDGQLSLEQATPQIKSNTRKYAKRQLTWFKKDTSITWINCTSLTKKDALIAMLAVIKTQG